MLMFFFLPSIFASRIFDRNFSGFLIQLVSTFPFFFYQFFRFLFLKARPTDVFVCGVRNIGKTLTFFLFSFPFFFELGFPSLLEDGGQFRIVLNLTLISRRNFQDNLTQDEK